jgi:hypothetical protein
MKIRFLASPIVAAFFVLNCWAQNAPASTPPTNSFLERLTSLADSDLRPWTAEQFATMGRIRDAAMTDQNAYNMLAHLTDNIGPRLSGSLQAQAAVEWVAAKMREMGASVTLEKTTVPHWVRGKGRRNLDPVAGNAAGDNAEDRCHSIGQLCANLGGWSYCKCDCRKLLCRIEELARW